MRPRPVTGMQPAMSDPLPQSAARRTDLDLLRILACAGIILAHAVLIFADEPRYHVKSAEPNWLANALYEALRIGTLPLFFALAGWSSVAGLRRRSNLRFLRDRSERVLLPLVAGVLLLGPIIKFIERGQGRDIGMSGWRMIEPLRAGFPDFLAFYWGRVNLLTWSHLWFLAYLFVISIVCLPLLRWLAARPQSAAVPGRAAALLPALGLAALVMAVGGYWPNLPNLVQDWGSLVFYAACVLAGASLAAWPGFEARLRQDAPWFLVLALAGYAIILAAGHTTIGRVGVGLCAWGAIGASLGYAGRHPPKPGAVLDWFGDSTMAVYVLHHVPVLLLGVWVLPMALPIAVKIAIIALGATAAALLSYRYLVRPWPLPRLLLGMGARPGPVKAVTASEVMRSRSPSL